MVYLMKCPSFTLVLEVGFVVIIVVLSLSLMGKWIYHLSINNDNIILFRRFGEGLCSSCLSLSWELVKVKFS